jgi:GntR family transcriptional regulator
MKSKGSTATPRTELERSAIPRYLQLATLFRRRIQAGEWQLGDQIPTVDELCKECGVARATMRQALGLLEAEGLISRFRAKGTFVNERPQDRLWLEVESDWKGLLTTRSGARIEILIDEPKSVPSVVPHPIGELAVSYRHLRRRHWRGKVPFLLADVYIDNHLKGKIPEAAYSELTALRLVTKIPGVRIVDVRQTLTIGTADLETAQLMNLALNEPVAYVNRSAIDQRGHIVMISNGIYRGDIVRIDTRLK